MTMKRLKRLFTGTLPLFLLLWAGMMALLVGLNGQKLKGEVQLAVQSACQNAESYYQSVWSGGATEARKPAILASWLGNHFDNYDGVIQFRFYDSSGKELARSQLTNSRASLPGTGVYDWYLRLDAVLSPEEQVELARKLREEPRLRFFRGLPREPDTASDTDALWCDVVGVVDEEQQVIYPKTITHVYRDREVTLVDTDSSFFEGKELSTMRFEAVDLFSALEARNARPREMLDQWQEVEQEVDLLFEGLNDLPDTFSSVSVSSNTACYPLSDGTLFGYGFSYTPFYQTIQDLKSTALFTLLAAIAMALFTDHRQRQALQRERDFARAAAHELKTPLAVLRAHAEALREDIAPEKREQYLDVVLSESDRMTTLVGRLLELARPQAKEKLHKEPVDLAALVQEVFAPLSLPLEQNNLHLHLELEEVSLTGDRAQLREAVENLASNALRYAASGGTIRVTVEPWGSRVRLTVYNDGPNIPSEDLPRLWEPFYRADPSRSRDSGGTGLGLAIVQNTVEAHGGRCWAENRPVGVAFVMELPTE